MCTSKKQLDHRNPDTPIDPCGIGDTHLRQAQEASENFLRFHVGKQILGPQYAFLAISTLLYCMETQCNECNSLGFSFRSSIYEPRMSTYSTDFDLYPPTNNRSMFAEMKGKHRKRCHKEQALDYDILYSFSFLHVSA